MHKMRLNCYFVKFDFAEISALTSALQFQIASLDGSKGDFTF